MTPPTALRSDQRPDLRFERALLRAGARFVVGMDEVGRGALAGPVSVGAVAVDLSTRTCPKGVADSKLLTAAARTRLLPALGRWGAARAVGHAGPEEIDAIGIIAALRLAGRRALAQLALPVDLVLLDGNHDWLSPARQPALFGDDETDGDPGPGLGVGLPAALSVGRPTGPSAEGVDTSAPPPALPALELEPFAVRTRIKADRSCASVAAASVLAKCERDAMMVRFAEEHPAYAWHENKGYGAPEHLEALRLLGPSMLHRRSWRLPLGGTGDARELDELGRLDELESLHELEGAVPAGPLEADQHRRWSMMDA